jgi:hypothetical protein
MVEMRDDGFTLGCLQHPAVQKKEREVHYYKYSAKRHKEFIAALLNNIYRHICILLRSFALAFKSSNYMQYIKDDGYNYSYHERWLIFTVSVTSTSCLLNSIRCRSSRRHGRHSRTQLLAPYNVAPIRHLHPHRNTCYDIVSRLHFYILRWIYATRPGR